MILSDTDNLAPQTMVQSVNPYDVAINTDAQQQKRANQQADASITSAVWQTRSLKLHIF